jgi:hypothetical protein
VPGSVDLVSHIPEICAGAVTRSHLIVEKTTLDIKASAKARLYAWPAIDTSALVNSGEHHVDGYEGEVGFGTDHSHLVEFGTGALGAASHFPGKPGDLEYSTDGRWETRRVSMAGADGGGFLAEKAFNSNWKGMAAQPYLIPSVEEQREPFGMAVGQIYDN